MATGYAPFLGKDKEQVSCFQYNQLVENIVTE
jgi:hypothetical protein